MKKRTLPPSANVAHLTEGARMVAPAASRNADAVAAVLSVFAPPGGRALELASGTGQHVAEFARRHPRLRWQPSDIDPERRFSIDNYTAGLDNVARALALDAAAPGWSDGLEPQNLIVLINLLHLITKAETEIVIAEVARALAPGGRFILYGPFMRDGQLTSEGDARFHASLIAGDPGIGYKDDRTIRTLLDRAGLNIAETIDMPANNLVWIAIRPQGAPG